MSINGHPDAATKFGEDIGRKFGKFLFALCVLAGMACVLMVLLGSLHLDHYRQVPPLGFWPSLAVVWLSRWMFTSNRLFKD